jgi:hypothetical protein
MGGVCGNCRTTVRRKGTDLEEYGKVGEIREDASLLLIGTRGKYKEEGFQLIGRIQLRYRDGTWNEWHMLFDDGDFGWLAEAQGFYSVHRPASADLLPRQNDGSRNFTLGDSFEIRDESFVANDVGKARCIGGEGELPFPVGQGYDLPFVDLASAGTACGTIDYSDDEPRLFLGHYVEFEELTLTGLREELPPDHPMALVGDAAVEKLNCPNCGGNLERRTGIQANAIYCEYCGSGIDVSAAPYDLFTKDNWNGFGDASLSLGSTGTWDGFEYTVLGIMIREATEWAVHWHEYLLHNPKRGYRWLINADGHWTWYTPLYEAPDLASGVTSATARGVTCSYHEANRVVVKRVVGEFYWRVKCGDRVDAVDYVNSPWMLSREQEKREVSWSLGKYVDAAEVKKAFPTAVILPRAGVAPHQPAPQDKHFKPLFLRFLVALAILFAGSVHYHQSCKDVVVIDTTYPVSVSRKGDAKSLAQMGIKGTRWVGPIDVTKSPSALEINLVAPVNQAWMYFAMALYNQDTGDAIDFGEEISFYSGPDWSEGGQTASVIVPKLKKGRHYLRIEPTGGGGIAGKTINYSLKIINDVSLTRWSVIAFFLLLAPLIWLAFGKMIFAMKKSAQEE